MRGEEAFNAGVAEEQALEDAVLPWLFGGALRGARGRVPQAALLGPAGLPGFERGVGAGGAEGAPANVDRRLGRGGVRGEPAFRSFRWPRRACERYAAEAHFVLGGPTHVGER